MISKLEALFNDRARKRRERAVRGALAALRDLSEAGVDAGVVGSIARGTFNVHSDVDFFIRNHPGKTIDEVIGIIEYAMKGFPFDVIFQEMVDDSELTGLQQELTYAPDLRQAASSHR